MPSRDDHELIHVPSARSTEHHVLGHDVLQNLHDAVEKAFIASRRAEHPDARQMLKQYMVGLLASVIAAPDSIAHAKGSAQAASEMLRDLVDNMLALYEANDNA